MRLAGMIRRDQVPHLPSLRRVREEAAISQDELARLSGVARPTITRIELLQRKARVSTVRKLAKALGVSPKDLQS